MLHLPAITPLPAPLPALPPALRRPSLVRVSSDTARVEFDHIALPGHELSFEARAGEFLHLAGGSAVSQLRVLAIASAFTFGGPGRCRLFGLDVMKLTAAQRLQLRRQQIGRVLQSDRLPSGLPLLAGVAQPALLGGMSAHEALHRAADELDAVGLVEQQSLPPTVLEAGTLRLALLARALVARPRLLLLERPEIGLDASDITTLMLALGAAAAAGSCVLMTSSHPRLSGAAHWRISLDAPGRPEQVS